MEHKRYLVIMQDEWNNLYYMGEYKELIDALPDINDFLEAYDIKLDELNEYPSTFGMCFDKDIETNSGFVMVRGFVLYG